MAASSRQLGTVGSHTRHRRSRSRPGSLPVSRRKFRPIRRKRRVPSYGISAGFPLQAVVFVALNTVIHAVVAFVIEEKHGFNKQAVGIYLVDQLKNQLLSLVITAPIIIILEWIVDNGGPYFFVYVWAFVSVVILILMTVYLAFIAPLFDKYIPLTDGELKTAIEKLAASVDYPLTKLLVVHGSKQSAHSNAYLYGFWNNKRIVLYVTLLSGEEKEKLRKECATEGDAAELSELDKARGMPNMEVIAVVGPELGHWALSHSVANLVISDVNLFFMFAGFANFSKWKAL